MIAPGPPEPPPLWVIISPEEPPPDRGFKPSRWNRAPWAIPFWRRVVTSELHARAILRDLARFEIKAIIQPYRAPTPRKITNHPQKQ
jgi:hypothetical protein